MKLGCFGNTGQIREIEKAGFDFAELDICELVSLSEEEFEEFRAGACAGGLSYDVFSGLLPLSLRLYEPSFDEECWLEHIETGAMRASKMGALLIPFGAGKCRSIPEGLEGRREECEKKLIGFVQKICNIFRRYHMILAIEPLGRRNSNFLNTIEETAEFAHRTGCGNCRIMCDLRHMTCSGEEPGVIQKYADDIVHAHIDYPAGRRRLFPNRRDGFDYLPYLQALKEAEYKGRLTIEAADYDDFLAEASEGCRYIRGLL